MYEEFYNLKEKPFSLNPSPRFLYLGDIHKEALALLTYGVIERKGFILLTGEVGTGKTTMVHALLKSLGSNDQYVYLSNPLFSPEDFREYLAFSVFKKKVDFKSKAEFLIVFENYLKEQLRNRKNIILIIDEAQKLSVELLEEIRLLSNMETSDEKLINIFLVGQPELNETLSRPECRPLLQRISIRYHIKPLDLEETGEYIKTRMLLTGSEKWESILPKNTVKAIYRFSEGYPRMINILADNALLLGYSRGSKKISPDMIKESYDDLQLEGSFFQVKAEEKKDYSPKTSKSKPNKRKWAWFALAVVVMIAALAVFAYYFRGEALNEIMKPVFSSVVKQDYPKNSLPAAQKKSIPNSVSMPIKKELSAGKGSSVLEKRDAQVNDDAKAKVASGANDTLTNTTQFSSHLKETEKPANFKRPLIKKNLTVGVGQTLTELTTEVYGYANDDILNYVQKFNPDIIDIDHIEVGQKIRFPELGLHPHQEAYTVHVASFAPFESARKLFNDLVGKGYEAYILPVTNSQRKKMFRVTIGCFDTSKEASKYASELLQKGVTHYAEPILFEVK